MKPTSGMIRAREVAERKRAEAAPADKDSPAIAGACKRPLRMKATAAEKTAVLYVYEQIGRDWWTGGGVTAKDVIEAIDDAKTAGCTSLDVRFLSEGGDAFEGVAIYEALKRCGLKTTGYNDGLAASAASYAILGCDRVVMAPTATTMIHKAWTLSMGNADDMAKMAEILSLLDGNIAGIYEAESGTPSKKCLSMMSEETWMNAEDCKSLGFCDEIAREESTGSEAEPDADPDDAEASAIVRLHAQTQARIKAFAAKREADSRMAANAARLKSISPGQPGSKERGQPAQK